MTNLNNLYEVLDDEGIALDCFAMEEAESFSLIHKGNCIIVINPLVLKSNSDERVKLAHEIGHCKTGSFYNMYAKLDIRAKHERRADKWAIKKLIPRDKLINAYKNGICDNSELAEHFGITEDFLQTALKYYNEHVA